MKDQTVKRKQSILLVNRDFQLRYTGAAVLIGSLSTFLTVVLLLYPLYQFEILRIPRFLPWPILIGILLAVVLNISLVALMTIVLTHRIAGPMYSLVRYFRRIEEGFWFGNMKVREDDDLKFVIRNFNAMQESLHKSLTSDYDRLHCIEQMLRSSKALDKGELEPVLGELQALMSTQKSRLEPPKE